MGYQDYPWEHAVDDTSGETYYINKNTQETTWEKPEDWDEVSFRNSVSVLYRIYHLAE